MLRIELLGGFRVLRDREALIRLPGARQQELIAFLILHAHRSPITRLRCATALWPDPTKAQALTNLRRELHHLRDEWPDLESRVHAGSRTLAWRADGAAVDVMAFEAAAGQGLAGDRTALSDAVREYRGELLPECSAEWIEPERENLRQRATRVLTELVQVLERDGAFEDTIEHVQRLIRLDPLNEEAWCTAMRCHARRGARATALHLYHECAALMKKELGVTPSASIRQTYREVLAVDLTHPATMPAHPGAAVYPLVGRSREWQTLLAAWQAAADSRARLALIRGESGIGKTRLAEEFEDWCRPNTLVLAARCYAGEGRLAYAPIAAWLKSDALAAAFTRLNASALSDIARLRPELLTSHPHATPPEAHLETWQRLRFFESIAEAFRSAAPIVLVLDDVQWADADTIEWLRYFLRSTSSARCLVLATARAEEEQDNPALGRLLVNLEQDDRLNVIPLARLDRAATGLLADAVAGHPLDEVELARAFLETEGHPLFIVERGQMDATGAPDAHARPATTSRVQAVVTARLGLLSPEARVTAEVASALGRDFAFDILSRATEFEEGVLVRALDELWRRNIVRSQAGDRWDFSHDRLREVAYAGIAPARARQIHRRIGTAMERLFAARLDDVSATVAVHMDRGGDPDRAVTFLVRAAVAAMRLSASEEALRCLTYALSLLERLSAGPERDERELALRSQLTVALNAGRGYSLPEVEANLDRVLVLFRGSGRQVPVHWLWVAFTMRYVLGDLTAARALAEEALARSETDSSYRCEAQHSMAAWLLSAGAIERSAMHFEAALSAYDDRLGRRSPLGFDLGVFVHAWYAHSLWLLGRDADALDHAEQAVALARRFDHPFSLALAFAYAGLLHQMRREPAAVVEAANAVLALCSQYGFAYYRDWANVLLGWARGQEQPVTGIEIIEAALKRLDADRAHARRPYYTSLLAETYARAGEGERAVSLVDAAIEQALAQQDVWWLPVLHLQKAELGPPRQREAGLRTALRVARAQGSRALERQILASKNAPSRRTFRERSPS